MSRQRKIPTPAWERDRGITGGLSASRLRVYAVVGVGLLVVAALAVIGWGFLSDYIADQQRPGTTAIRVNDREYTVGDYTERARMYVGQTGSANYQAVLTNLNIQLVEEAILLEFASEKGVEVSEDEIRVEIADMLRITAADPTFDQLLQEELDSIDLSEEEYHDIARAAALRTKLLAQFKDELPATAESVHYRQIVVADQATADNLKAQIEEGADFGTLAMENSTDTATKDNGGDAGWVPRGTLSESLDNLLFGLEVDQVVTYPSGNNVTIYQVTEADAARAVDADKKDTLAARDYQDWIDEKREASEIFNDLDLGSPDYDVDKITYVIDHADLTG